jgi:protein-disulfide isomerase
MRRVVQSLAAVSALVLFSCTAPSRGPVAPDAARDNTIGSANASVTIDEWADFQCPACRNFAALQAGLDQAVLRDGNARFVFHHMAFLGPESILAAEAAECAGDQGRFWAYHDRLYAAQNGENRGTFSAEHLKQFATTVALDQGVFNGCLESHKYVSRVQQETQAGVQLGVNSTPTLFVNGQRVGLTTYRDPVETIRLAVQNAKPR